ncbi:ABC transporter substrate-binding protein [Streptomyces boninensis]|uniref:ABC transporter substrate-binding protein n=1 Tax=Streptomyces boninensis TaxID=2039455 RepID=UPI003B21453D
MTTLSRRALLGAIGAAGATAALGACSTAPSAGKSSGGGKGLKWWDHFNPLQDLHKEVFAEFQKDTGIPVEYTPQQTGKMGQALQLARQSHQLPDVFTNAGLQLPPQALVKAGWFQPMELSEKALSRLPDDALVDGINVIDGKVYNFPLFHLRQYWAATWFNKELVEKAGLDPDSPPETYDEFRKAALAVRKKGGGDAYAWMLALGQPPRLREQIGFLAQAGGFEGHAMDGVRYKTGEIAFHDDAYVHAIEFWLSLKKDKLLVPGTESFVDKDARARWAAGTAAFYFDGPWCAGVVSRDLKQFADKLGVGPMLVAEKGAPVTAYRPPSEGPFWISGESKKQKDASRLLEYFTRPEHYVKLAAKMDQPPLDLDAIDKADVHPTYKQVVALFQDAVFKAPAPAKKNPDVAKVQAEQKSPQPQLGEVVQGLFSGDLTSVRGELKKLSDRNAKDREQAMAKAKKKGAKVDVDSWAFPNWEPRKDYTADMYKA